MKNRLAANPFKKFGSQPELKSSNSLHWLASYVTTLMNLFGIRGTKLYGLSRISHKVAC
jgi:hypothetical protein